MGASIRIAVGALDDAILFDAAEFVYLQPRRRHRAFTLRQNLARAVWSLRGR